MGERQSYYQRQEATERYPSHFMSDISDGMAGDKTKVPSLSDRFEFKPPLDMHVRLTQNIYLFFCFFLCKFLVTLL